MMKVSRTLALCAASALSSFALASSSIPPQSAGTLQAILDFCAKVDPKDSDSFQALGKKLTGLSEHELATVRGDPVYQDARDTLAKSAPKDAARTCAASVGPVADVRAIHRDSDKRERPGVNSKH